MEDDQITLVLRFLIGIFACSTFLVLFDSLNTSGVEVQAMRLACKEAGYNNYDFDKCDDGTFGHETIIECKDCVNECWNKYFDNNEVN